MVSLPILKVDLLYNNNMIERIDPTSADIQQLTELITYTYRQLLGDSDEQNPTLTKMFLSILVAKDTEVDSGRQALEESIRNITVDLYMRDDEFIKHAKDQEVEGLTNRELKIIKRLIDLKNEKQLKFEHICKKYDQLIEMMKASRANEDKLDKQIEQLKKINNNLQTKSGTHQAEVNGLKKKLAKYQLNFPKLSGIKQQIQIFYKQLKDATRESITNMKKQSMKMLLEISKKYQQNISRICSGWRSSAESLKNAQKEKEKQSQFLRQALKELVRDHSEKIKYPKKQDESDEEWIMNYRVFKKKASSILNRESAVLSNFNITDHQNYLDNIRRQIDLNR